ncbi:MAG: 1-acyl-sn-glycerol-3-phosphate acyltransferase, partial [Acidobacteria bacterium]|nr:1-acyl-sn-glycerol-3-phosphate acyltransferase [Acidobacteriota bacterium]
SDIIKAGFYFISKAFVSMICYPYFRVKAYGKENIPRKGKLIVAANHFSYLDPLTLGIAFPRRIHYIMTSVYYEKIILKQLCYLLDTIPIGEGLQVFAFKKTMRVLSKEGVVGIFPEGQRSRAGFLLEARKGVGVYALRSKAPVLPAAIVGTREALPAHSFFPKPHKVKIFYGKPLQFGDDTKPEEVSDAIKREIAKLFIENGYEDYVKEEERID